MAEPDGRERLRGVEQMVATASGRASRMSPGARPSRTRRASSWAQRLIDQRLPSHNLVLVFQNGVSSDLVGLGQVERTKAW